MVSQGSPSNQASSMLHHFIVSDSITSQNQFDHHNQNFNAYNSDIRGSSSNTFPHSLGDLILAPQEPKISHTRHFMDLLGAANESHQQAQRSLSLSLGSQMLMQPQVQYRQRSFNSDIISPSYIVNPGGGGGEEERQGISLGLEQVNNNDYFTATTFASPSVSLSRSSSNSYCTESFPISVGNSRFLRPTQLLLEETVNISGRTVDISNEHYVENLFRSRRELSSALKAELSSNGFVSAEKQELQVKIAKLISLLEEVEDRFEKYYHQLEEVVASFEEIAGLGAAKSYTALALQAMSRHFCSLRDGIVSQINAARRRISQNLPKISSGLSNLSLFDKESSIHSRISLQQLGIIQNQRQAWRPIRGLPETSVAILRAWLFEHFLHPYPNDSEKLMLASQTGLTKNQVSNWFINARVRLWKPMIEEMYKEEFADSNSEDSNPLIGGSSSSMTREGVTDNSEE